MRDTGDGGLSVIGMALVIGILVAMVSVPISAGVVNFSDPGLETAIRAALGKPTGDIRDTDLIGLTSLDARYHNIASLEGIEYCVDLTELNLYGNAIVDISPLSNLTNLTTLILNRNRIVDISALSGLINLTALHLRNNQICDIAPLVNNPGFARDHVVALSYNQLLLQPDSPNMHDIEALQGRGIIVFFAPIVNFPDPGFEAAIRDALGKPTKDILDADLIGLTSLDAHYHNIVSLEGIEHCVNLTELNLYGNKIVEIGTLSSLTNLTGLYLEDNEIVDISALSGLTNLTRLSLDHNEIIDINALSGLTNLTRLYLWKNEIVDISALSGLTNLTELYLYFNEIIDISALSSLTNLTGLGLTWNYIVDISALSSLTHLTRLYLDNNQIVDIAPLVNNAGIGSGDIVNLQGNQLPLQSGSVTMLDIEVLLDRGVDVNYAPQN